MIITVSPVIESPKGFGFGVFLGDNKKGFQFETEKGAKRGRAKFIKDAKSRGMKIAYGQNEEYK